MGAGPDEFRGHSDAEVTGGVLRGRGAPSWEQGPESTEGEGGWLCGVGEGKSPALAGEESSEPTPVFKLGFHAQHSKETPLLSTESK